MADELSILVVDDQKVIGELFDFTLGFSGHQITVVNNARAALDAIQEVTFDIAFLDIVMPHKDGIEILKEIKAAAPKLPVVMMTGYSLEDKKLQAKKLGAVTCLKKPFEIDDIKRVIKEVLNRDI